MSPNQTHADNDEYILTAACPCGKGIVADVTGFLAEQGAFIASLEQYDNESTGNFFMRAVFRPDESVDSIVALRDGFSAVAQRHAMDYAIHDPSKRARVLVMVSKTDHCLADLLYRVNNQDLHMDIVAVVSNHKDLRPMVERDGIRFVHLPIDGDNKRNQERRLIELVDETQADLVVLARYMQILSDELTQELSGRCINIHHSFLPGFKGARPYYQAYERGVKQIGATAHYVTTDLDEGPIIEQVVERVDHNYTPQNLTRVGRDNESKALSRAVKYHIEHRVFLDGQRTVVFKGGRQ